MLATFALAASLCSPQSQAPQTPAVPDLRPPSVPLVVHDPYFSIWLPHDRPTDGWTAHWTGKTWPMCSLLRIDGTCFRLLGPEPAGVPALPWQRTEVTPTRTTFSYANDQVAVAMTFLTPALPEQLRLMSRPVTYVSWTASSVDHRAHALELHLDVTAAIAVDQPDQLVAPQSNTIDGFAVHGTGSVEQQVLGKKGDDLRIDWGCAWLAQDAKAGPVQLVEPTSARQAFQAQGALGAGNDVLAPTRAGAAALRLRAALTVPAEAPARHVAMLAYDDGIAIRYFDDDLPALWRRVPGASPTTLLQQAALERPRLEAACTEFDAALAAGATALGGVQYAQLCALAYRQVIGGIKICADRNGQPLVFPKENFSNGCIATVDVIYPMAPFFLLFGSDLARAMLIPVLDYGSSPRWKFPFAPHDLGTYPHATGQVYGGGEHDEQNQMPVEESANLILLVAALCQREGTAEFALHYWPALAKWAAYLESKGFDPALQLCTDDFTGHLAHNVNLSAKAILALGAFAQLCTLAGKADEAKRWRALAEGFAAKWMAEAPDGDATRLAFDKPGTWSQKYNLAWDSVLGLQLFPREVLAREVAAYKKRLTPYGLPLDSRATFSKIDWSLWSGSLTNDRADFEAFVAPAWRWVHETPDRVPICDWYETKNRKKINMIARPVVGAFFLRFLQDAATWQKWFVRGERSKAAWAPAPISIPEPLVPCATEAAVEWRYTTTEPAAGWERPGLDDGKWQRGRGGFGTKGTPGAIVGTEWSTDRIWLRREFTLEQVPAGEVKLWIHHDEDATVWLDGTEIAALRGYTTGYTAVALSPAAQALLTAGKHTLAVRCAQTSGGQYVDVGFVRAVPAK